MGDRLRARDLAFLTAETPTAPRHNATVEIFDPGASGFDHETLVRADRRPDRVRAALPAAGALGARPPRQPGLGRRPALRPRLPRTPLRPAAPGTHGAAARAGRPDRRPGPSTATARCGRSTSSRVSRTAASRCCPRPTRPWSTAPRSSTSRRCCSTATPHRRVLGADEWRPGAPGHARPGCSSRRSATRVAAPFTALDTVRGAADSWWRGADAADPARRDGRQRAGQPPFRAGHPDRRHRCRSSAGS